MYLRCKWTWWILCGISSQFGPRSISFELMINTLKWKRFILVCFYYSSISSMNWFGIWNSGSLKCFFFFWFLILFDFFFFLLYFEFDDNEKEFHLFHAKIQQCWIFFGIYLWLFVIWFCNEKFQLCWKKKSIVCMV